MIRGRRWLVLALMVTAGVPTIARAQRGPRGGSLPRITMGTGPATVSSGIRRSGMGVAVVPRGGTTLQRRGGDGARLFTAAPRRAGPGFGPTSDPRGGLEFGSRFGARIGTGTARRPFARAIVRSGCSFGCSCGIRGCRAARFVGVPFGFVVPIPFIYESYESYGYSTAAVYTAEPEPRDAAPTRSKVIVVGAGGAGDALTVESLRDSVRLSWLASGKPVREVRLFLADSAQRQLASRSASPTNPRATFETATLSAPVAFAGVTVVFADGVTSTTVVPYRREEGR